MTQREPDRRSCRRHGRFSDANEFNLVATIENYLRSRNLPRGTRDEYSVTMRKWIEWGKDVPIEQMGRNDIREFLDWVRERAVSIDGGNPGRTSNKARENLRAVLAWAWELDLIDALPRFPQAKQQRSVAGRHYLTKAELNALIANIKPKRNVESGAEQPWLLKDLRKTCATHYDQHLPESSIEILGHSVGGVTYRHYAHRDPLAFKAITTIPQPSAFLSLVKGIDGECPCCRRKF